jgi:hypothetical protein
MFSEQLDLGLRPQSELSTNASPSTNPAGNHVSYIMQPRYAISTLTTKLWHETRDYKRYDFSNFSVLNLSFRISPGTHTTNPTMTMIDSHSSQYMLSPNHLPGYHFPGSSNSIVAHPVGNPNTNLQNPITTASIYPPIYHQPMAHNARDDFEETVPRPLTPRPTHPLQQQIEATELYSQAPSAHSTQ